MHMLADIFMNKIDVVRLELYSINTYIFFCIRYGFIFNFFLYVVLFNLVNNSQPRKIGSVADIDPINGVYGSMDGYNYAHQSHSQPTTQQPAHHHQLHYGQQQSQSAIQQKPIQKSISSQVVSLLVQIHTIFFFMSI